MTKGKDRPKNWAEYVQGEFSLKSFCDAIGHVATLDEMVEEKSDRADAKKVVRHLQVVAVEDEQSSVTFTFACGEKICFYHPFLPVTPQIGYVVGKTIEVRKEINRKQTRWLRSVTLNGYTMNTEIE